LQLRIEPHQSKVADFIGLGQLQPSGIHALKDQLRIIVAPI